MPFDPNRPFTVVKPAFDPSKPFEASAPQFDPSKPFVPADEEEGRNWAQSKEMTDEEIQGIAARHGVAPDYLRKWAPFMQAQVREPGVADYAKEAAGFVGESAGLGIPQKIAEMTAADSKHEEALHEMRQLADKKKSWGRKAAELVVPGAGIEKLAVEGAKAGLGAAMKSGAKMGAAAGAAGGFGNSAPGEEVTGTALGATVGAGLGSGVSAGLSKLAGRKATKLAEKGGEPRIQARVEEHLGSGGQATIDAEKAALRGDLKPLQETVDITSPEFQALQSTFPDKSVDEIRQIAAISKLEDIRGKVAKKVGAENWEQAVKEQGGIDRMLNVHQLNSEEDIAKTLAAKYNLGVDRQLMGVENQALKLVAANEVAKIADKRAGTDLEQILADGGARRAVASNWDIEDAGEFGKLLEVAKKHGFTEDNGKLTTSSLEGGNVPPELGQAFREYTTGQLARQNARGAGIRGIESYTRHAVVDSSELAGRFKGELNRLESRYSEPGLEAITPDQFNILKDKGDFRQFLDGLTLITKKPIETARDFTNAYRSILKGEERAPIPDIAGIMGPGALSPAKERTGKLPVFLREENQLKALRQQITSVNHSLATRDMLLKLSSEANKLDAVGDVGMAKYFRTLADDLRGPRPGTIAADTNELVRKWKTAQISKGNQALADLPDSMNVLRESLYSNTLGGFNVVPAIQNLLTPTMTVLPDLGGVTAKYGLQTLGKSARDVIFNPAKLETELAAKGIVPVQFHPVDAKVLHNQGMPRNQVAKFNNYMSTLFSKTEQAARAQVYHLGRDMGADMAANPEFGRKIVNGLNSESYRRTIQRAIDKGDTAEVQRQFTNYLNSNHLLNYGKENQAELVRSLGPLFSAFSRWPTAVVGKVVQEYYDKPVMAASLAVTRKLLAPYFLLRAADHYVRGPEEDRSAISKLLLGKDAGNLAPASSLFTLSRYAEAPAPIKAVGQVGKAGMAAVTGDTERARELVNKLLTGSLTSYLPVIGTVVNTYKRIDKLKED